MKRDSSSEDDDYMSDALLGTQSQISKKTKISATPDESVRRQQGLRRRLDESNKGFRLLQSMGFQTAHDHSQPIDIKIAPSRNGIGYQDDHPAKSYMDTKTTGHTTDGKAKVVVDPDEYRKLLVRRKEIARTKFDLKRIRVICEDLDTRQNLPRSRFWPPKHDDDAAILQEADDASGEQMLKEAIAYLREQHQYCFWCGCSYQDVGELVQICPGPARDDHDDY